MAKVKIKSRIGSLLRGDLRGGNDNAVVTKVTRPSGVTVSVVRGRLEKEDVDVIVNSLSVSMNLEHGVLTTAISSKAGPGLQEAVDEFPGPAQYGDVFKTAGFKLRARAVYHVVLCGFNYPNAGSVLEDLILRCLELADKDKRTSISIPALGTGRHAFPEFVVAHRMMEAVRRYEGGAGHNPIVRKIRFVFTEGRCQGAFQSALTAIPNASQKNVVDRVKNFRRSTLGQKSLTVKPSEAAAEGETVADGSMTPPPVPPTVHTTQKVKRPNKLQTKLVKALGVHKTFKKEQLINQLRTKYRELPLPQAFVSWNYVVSSKGSTVQGRDMDALLEATVGTELHKKRSLVLVHGLSYVGKSSLVNRIARVWADGGLRHIRLVIVVNLQVLLTGGGYKTPTLRECLLQCFASAGIDTSGGYQLFEFSSGKMLLLIDDAEAWCEHFRDELALDPLFAKAHVLVTSRTSSSVRLADAFHPKLTVELSGFGTEHLENYVRLKGPVNPHRMFTLLVEVAEITTGPTSIHIPGWLEHYYEIIDKEGDFFDKDSIKRHIETLHAYLEATTDPDWLQEFMQRRLQVGEAFLHYLIHKKDPGWTKFEKMNLLDIGPSPRSLIDYCIAAYIIDEIWRTGQPPYSLNTLERVYLLQNSLELSCGHNQRTARVINKLITMIADDDGEVQVARARALDKDDTDSARTLKRVNDLQVACLRQGTTPKLSDSLSDVPEELRFLGAECSRVYLLACENGTKAVRRTRVMLVGHFGAGKTSLKRRLVNETFIPEYRITNGIEADPSACTIQVDDTCNWKLLEEALQHAQSDEHSSEVARLVYSFIKKLNAADLPVSDEPEIATPDIDVPETKILDFSTFAGSDSELDEPDGPVLGHTSPELLEVDRDRAPSSGSSTGSDIRPPPNRSLSMDALVEAMGEAGMSDAEKVVDSLPPQVIEELKKLMLRESEDSGSLSRSGRQEVKFTFWDFAGQNVFYTTHQTFLSHRAIYLLVLDLTRPLHFRIETSRLSRHGSVIDRACPQTVGEYLDYWLNSIHTHCVARDPQHTGLLQPPVIIVCTHKDTLIKEHGKEAADRMVKEYFVAIEKHLDKKAYANHVYAKFFAVSNSIDNDPALDKVRKVIVQVAEEQPYWGEQIPLKWLALRKKLRGVQESGGSVVSRREILELAQDVGLVGQQEVNTVLLFYHELGELVYFDEEHLRDFAILDPQWLIENFREVITIRQFHKQRMFPNSRSHWTNLDDYGVLNDIILENVWDKECKEQLVSIMQKFNLILPINADYRPDDDFEVPDLCESTRLYLVPCMLPQVTADDIPPPTKSDPAPIMLAFKEGFVPLGLFHRLLATCINQLKWQPFGVVYHDFASFLTDESEPITISLHMRETHIEVTARSLDLEEEELEEGQGDPKAPMHTWTRILPVALNTLKHQLEVHIRTVSPTQEVFLATRCTCKGPSVIGALIKLDRFRRMTPDGKRMIMCLSHRKPISAQSIQPWFAKPPDPTEIPAVGITVTAPPPMEDIPTEQQLLSLAEELSHEWEELGIHLGVSRAQINQCKMDYPHNARLRINDMLQRWRHSARVERCSRRLDQLTHGLLQTRRADLAEKVAHWRLCGKDLNLDWDEVMDKRPRSHHDDRGRVTL